VLLGGLAGLAHAGVQRVQVTANNCWGGCSLADGGPEGLLAPFPFPSQRGNTVVVGVGWNPANAPVPTLTDSAGHQYQLAAGPVLGFGGWNSTCALYYAPVVDGGVILGLHATTVAVDSVKIMAVEYSGISWPNPLDVATFGENSNGVLSDSTVSAPFTTTTPGDALVAVVFNDRFGGLLDAGAGFTWELTFNGDGVEDFLGVDLGTYQASAPGVTPGTVLVAAFRSQPGGAGGGSGTAGGAPGGGAQAGGAQGGGAATGDSGGGVPSIDRPPHAVGCGCVTTASATMWASLVLLLLVGHRRRAPAVARGRRPTSAPPRR
jgi:MYXO-CTERM domain-containing protein